MQCQYCGEEAIEIYGSKLYPYLPDLKHKKFFFCDNGHEAAWVGCHRNGKPLGRLADSDTRHWRNQAHQIFDPVWQVGNISRSKSYKIMADVLNLTRDEAHIGMFSVDQCKELIKKMPEIKRIARGIKNGL